MFRNVYLAAIIRAVLKSGFLPGYSEMISIGSMWLWHLIDWFFVVFHTALIFFNLFGWIPKRIRKWNLLVLLLTAASWYLLGIFYGWGYCFLTDWHWQVLGKLSVSPSEHSYVQYLLRRLLGMKVSADFADILTASLFFAALAISVYVNLRAILKARLFSRYHSGKKQPDCDR